MGSFVPQENYLRITEQTAQNASCSCASGQEGGADTSSHHDLLKAMPYERFEHALKLAAELFEAPAALIPLLERDLQLFGSRIGAKIREAHCHHAFGGHGKNRRDGSIVSDGIDRAPCYSSSLSSPGRDLESFVAGGSSVENIVGTSPDAILRVSEDGQVTFWNKAAEALFGYSAAQIREASFCALIPERLRQNLECEMEHLHGIGADDPCGRTFEFTGRRKDGSEFPAEFSVSAWNEAGAMNIGCIVRDVTERHRNEDRLFRLASVDPLTELPNRSSWHTCVTEIIESAQPATMMLLDLDGFKAVNDTVGHATGDAVLKEVAKRLTAICGAVIMVARLGGDEFVLLLPGNDPAHAGAFAEHLVSVVSRPYAADGGRTRIGASIGISLAPQHGATCDELLRAGDLALFRAKAAGKAQFEIFTPALREAAVVHRAFEQELRAAFENDEFELYYQPQVLTSTRRIVGAEALMRWNHPQRGLLTPASFIDVLSKKPSAAAVGEWTIRTACRQAAEWRKEIPDFRLGINLFEAQFRSGRLLGVIEESLADSGLPPEALELEIVENVLLQNDSTTLDLLHSLRGLGVGLAFDDYGTGFASLSLLKRYPVTRLKIDRSFVRDMTTDAEDAAVVKAILFLAENFGLNVIAEGVEREDQFEFLRDHTCHEAQGYLFGHAITAERFTSSLRLRP